MDCLLTVHPFICFMLYNERRYSIFALILKEERKMKEKILENLKKFLRSTRRGLNDEIARCEDELSQLKPGSAAYKQIKADYLDLIDRKKEFDKNRKEFLSKPICAVLAAVLGIVGIVIYRRAIETTNDPFFRDLGKWILKISG